MATFERERAQALYDEGHSCRSIADTLGVAPSTVSRWAKNENLLFDRSQTDMATRAHTIDLAADRLLLTKMMLVNAQDALASVDGPYLVYSFGGKENEYNEHELDSAPIEARRSAQVIAGVAHDKMSRILDRDDGGLDETKGALSDLGTLLHRAADALRNEEATETTDDAGA